MRKSLTKLAEKGGPDPGETLARVVAADELVPADLLIEAITEDAAAKEEVFRRADEILPARSRTAYCKVDVAMGGSSASTGQPVEVLDVVALLEPVLVGDLVDPHQLGEVLVEGVHAVLGAGLHRGVDLVHHALADQVTDRPAS